ncbi:LOW QUALITY PROTEIN: testis-expressed protein 12 [Phoenicopterus ruber ruber]
MTSNTQKSDENRSKRKKRWRTCIFLCALLLDEASENPQLSSLDKTDLAFSEGSQSLYKPETLEKVLNGDAVLSSEKVNGFSIDFNYRFFQLSERAAMDASYVQELDGILKEARTIENHLKQKRESLKQRFTVIANTLQS